MDLEGHPALRLLDELHLNESTLAVEGKRLLQGLQGGMGVEVVCSVLA